MKRIGLGALSLLAALIIGVMPALAGDAHFSRTSSYVNGWGTLVVMFGEGGLSGGQSVAYTVTATASIVYGCVDTSQNRSSPTNLTMVSGPVSGGGSYTASASGDIKGSVGAGPLPAPAMSCPAGTQEVIVSAGYSAITLTDTTNGVSTAAPDYTRTLKY